MVDNIMGDRNVNVGYDIVGGDSIGQNSQKAENKKN